MLPIGTLLNIGGKLVGGYMNRRRAISDQKHRVALEEIRTGNERAKRNGSLILDLLLGSFILAPLGILAYGTFWGDPAMLAKTKDYFDMLKEIPDVYLYLIFIVVGGNYGISVTNLLSGKKFK
tara:strand:+ start:589 stop:957 length:369 start_codon:yes stop_codon:yes gene_type:complete